MDIDQASAELKSVITQLIDEQAIPLSQRDRVQLGEEILHEVYGLGPIEPLLRDPDVSDILVNGPRQVFIERTGKLGRPTGDLRDDAHLLRIIDASSRRSAGASTNASPMVDARLPDGSRVNAIIPPLALDGPMLTIRKIRPQAVHARRT